MNKKVFAFIGVVSAMLILGSSDSTAGKKLEKDSRFTVFKAKKLVPTK